jgi:molybdopterin/thiamine biosynthesis adenylyltransferase
MASENTLSKEEAQLYDRQLRLWGVQSQQRLQQSKVVIIGLSAVQSEIAKNIVLAGLNEISIIDWVVVEPRHTVPHLFLDPKTSVGQNVRLK